MGLRRFIYLVHHALPLVTSSIGLMLIGLVDTVTVARLGNHALVAQSLAAFINMTIFMGCAAFIFPIANLYQLNRDRRNQYLATGLYLLLPIGVGITLCNWLTASFLATSFLPIESQALFIDYFCYASLRIIPGILFFYVRMLMYTTDKPVQLLHYMLAGFLLNSLGNFGIYHTFHDMSLVMKLLGLWGAFIFLMLTWVANQYLPPSKRLLSLFMNSTWHRQSIKEVLQTTVPAMLTSYFEYLFFCIIGIILLKNVPEHFSVYRVILQLEELVILLFYGLCAVISIEISKQISQKTLSLRSDVGIYSGMVFISAMLLYYLLPNLFKLFDIYFPQQHVIYLINAILLIAECTMLLSLAYLRGIGRNQTILAIMFIVNWIIIFPLLFWFQPQRLDDYLYALIINYLIISSSAFVVFKRINKSV